MTVSRRAWADTAKLIACRPPRPPPLPRDVVELLKPSRPEPGKELGVVASTHNCEIFREACFDLGLAEDYVPDIAGSVIVLQYDLERRNKT